MRMSRFAATGAAAIAALATVGVAGATAPPSEPTADDAAFEFAQCMRDNGVTAFPDPQVDAGGGIFIQAPEGVTPEEMAPARAACEHILGGGGAAASGDSDWEKVVPGGDCECADGSEFAFWVREGDPNKVVLYLDGGGSCFDETSCDFTGYVGENDYYDFSQAGETPGLGGGVFDFERADNPLADYTIIYLSLCTGDVYLGDVTREYSPELTVEHNGFVNGSAGLTYLAENYPDASQVVVVGKTAGSIAAPIYGGLVSDLLPDAQVTVFGAQSGGFPDDPEFNAEILGELWGAYGNMPDWEVNEGLTASDWGINRFWIQAGLHDPDILMARFDYAYDANAARGVEQLTGEPQDLLALIDANEAAIEAAGVTQHSYTAPGDDHGIFEFDAFYEIEVNGVRLVDWVAALLAGEPLDDVHCADCGRPA